jgi:hypothetical protein
MTFCLHLLGISHAIHRILNCDSAYGVTKAEGRTLAEVEEILQKTDARLARLEELFIDGRIEKSNPRYLAARDQHAAAEAERERLAGRRKDKREELHDLAETIGAFWYATPDTAVALAWLGGDDEKKRELVRRTLTTLTFYPDRVTFSFRLDLPNSVAIDRPYLFERHARFTRRDRLITLPRRPNPRRGRGSGPRAREAPRASLARRSDRARARRSGRRFGSSRGGGR